MRLGAYEIHAPIAAGGFGRVHLAKRHGPGGFGRLCVAKSLRDADAEDPAALLMLLDEARITSVLTHPNVVPILDVERRGSEYWLFMEYVDGASLSALLAAAARQGETAPAGVAVSVGVGVLRGLHAAHEATDGAGQPLHIVHRDVSPHNVIVSAQGSARVVDFGIATASVRLGVTREGHLKRKLSYMAPEQLSGGRVDRRADVYAAALVVVELLSGRRVRSGATLEAALAEIDRVDEALEAVPASLAGVLRPALARRPGERPATAAALADALEAAAPAARAREVGTWVERLGGPDLEARRRLVRALEEGDGPTEGAEDRPSVTGAALLPEPEGSAPPSSSEPSRGGDAPRGEEATRPQHANVTSRAPTLLALLAGATLGGAAYALWLRPAPEATSVRPSAARLDARAPPRAAPGGEEPPAIVGSPRPAAASAVASVSRSAPVTATSPPRPPPSPRSPAPPRASSEPTCQPPYVVDARGVRVLRPECMR